VHRAISRSNRNQFLLALLTIGVVLACCALSYRYLVNFFLGPQPLNAGQVNAITNLDAQVRYYVTVTGDDVADTGFQEVSRSKTGTETVKASFFALLVDQQIVLVKGQGEATSKVYTGALVEIPADVRSEVITGIEADEPSLKGRFLPFMLDTSDFRTNGYIGLGLGLLLVLVACGLLLRLVGRILNPLKHPIMRALKRFGDPEDIAAQIDREMDSDHTKLGQMHLTSNWLLQRNGAILNVTRLNDVMWLYQMVTQHRTNGVPTGKTYAAHIWDRYGVCIIIPGKEDAVKKVLETVFQRVPWVAAGHTDEIAKAWKADRVRFAAMIDQRRTQAH
jgi:hypothetical protein